MFALYEQGIQPAEIARRCAAGLASVAPFEIPRRTVQEIVTGMARERGQRTCRTRSRTCSTATARNWARRYPRVVLGLINADGERLKEKCARSALSLDEYNRLRAGMTIHKQIVAQAGGPTPTPARKHRGERRGAQEVEGSALERLERYIEKKQPESSSTNTEHVRTSVTPRSPRLPAERRRGRPSLPHSREGRRAASHGKRHFSDREGTNTAPVHARRSQLSGPTNL